MQILKASLWPNFVLQLQIKVILDHQSCRKTGNVLTKSLEMAAMILMSINIIVYNSLIINLVDFVSLQ